uniref:Uncharacterized protein n=1 Tax=Chromera velia CCMP2878 TaxID=1169474 RepID=A0A0G4HSM5_9ALVE|eukprot:Cvel_8296.t1-p1 / transcript=Cvel_8296.t1 / gene=Cvel_8296 / organism=Chromera_velia_CCMP2878 / gene_product=hypothetical protein / transcript_product=hypothetical protein / location=Cvel_scaffold455:39978-51779(-) / protein_length=770 / sequence_SO=supercontig / SO=protein_coding / is_pseudo=false
MLGKPVDANESEASDAHHPGAHRRPLHPQAQEPSELSRDALASLDLADIFLETSAASSSSSQQQKGGASSSSKSLSNRNSKRIFRWFWAGPGESCLNICQEVGGKASSCNVQNQNKLLTPADFDMAVTEANEMTGLGPEEWINCTSHRKAEESFDPSAYGGECVFSTEDKSICYTKAPDTTRRLCSCMTDKKPSTRKNVKKGESRKVETTNWQSIKGIGDLDNLNAAFFHKWSTETTYHWGVNQTCSEVCEKVESRKCDAHEQKNINTQNKMEKAVAEANANGRQEGLDAMTCEDGIQGGMEPYDPAVTDSLCFVNALAEADCDYVLDAPRRRLCACSELYDPNGRKITDESFLDHIFQGVRNLFAEAFEALVIDTSKTFSQGPGAGDPYVMATQVLDNTTTDHRVTATQFAALTELEEDNSEANEPEVIDPMVGRDAPLERHGSPCGDWLGVCCPETKQQEDDGGMSQLRQQVQGWMIDPALLPPIFTAKETGDPAYLASLCDFNSQCHAFDTAGNLYTPGDQREGPGDACDQSPQTLVSESVFLATSGKDPVMPVTRVPKLLATSGKDPVMPVTRVPKLLATSGKDPVMPVTRVPKLLATSGKDPVMPVTRVPKLLADDHKRQPYGNVNFKADESMDSTPDTAKIKRQNQGGAPIEKEEFWPSGFANGKKHENALAAMTDNWEGGQFKDKEQFSAEYFQWMTDRDNPEGPEVGNAFAPRVSDYLPTEWTSPDLAYTFNKLKYENYISGTDAKAAQQEEKEKAGAGRSN